MKTQPRPLSAADTGIASVPMTDTFGISVGEGAVTYHPKWRLQSSSFAAGRGLGP